MDVLALLLGVFVLALLVRRIRRWWPRRPGIRMAILPWYLAGPRELEVPGPEREVRELDTPTAEQPMDRKKRRRKDSS